MVLFLWDLLGKHIPTQIPPVLFQAYVYARDIQFAYCIAYQRWFCFIFTKYLLLNICPILVFLSSSLVLGNHIPVYLSLEIIMSHHEWWTFHPGDREIPMSWNIIVLLNLPPRLSYDWESALGISGGPKIVSPNLLLVNTFPGHGKDWSQQGCTFSSPTSLRFYGANHRSLTLTQPIFIEQYEPNIKLDSGNAEWKCSRFCLRGLTIQGEKHFRKSVQWGHG